MPGDNAHQIPGSPKGDIKPLSLLPLVMLIFFEVSGGPFGTEDAVNAAGPLLCIIGFIAFPLIWSVPEALMTAELATAFPENSGYVAWVTAAFGPMWGFQEGFWSWLSGVTDNGVYPVILAANLEIFFPQLGQGWTRVAFLFGLSLSLAYLNYRGLTVVGHTIITAVVVILVPFIILTLLCIPSVEPKNWIRVDWDNVDWGTYVNVMFWNLNMWDRVSTLAGEVHNPRRTLPRAMLLAVLLVVLMYLLPTMAVLGVTNDTDEVQMGFYGRVAEKFGGHWLAVWVVVAAASSSIGQFQAEMASDSYQLQGMAERGFLPKVLGYRSPHDTPTLGILLSSLGVLGVATLDFVSIVQMLNAIYCLAEILEFAAFIHLRIKCPNLHRPYRVPLPTWALTLMMLPAFALLFIIILLPVYNRNYVNVACTVGAASMGFILWPLLQVARRRGWCEFEPMHFDVAGVLGPIPPSGVCLPAEEVPHSLEHQNLRVESAVPGHHALLLEHQRLSGHEHDHEYEHAENGDSISEPLLRSSAGR
ncbi:hypothetical protein CEUSTIGMA_g8906.t1 [Chlamydomonas eustigma]|uniref:Amino acid permease/ SLC12A domain-containing protein n=1 Tax=Chlamydomonas eustigma TaxID=1157962 RepID=A0A250XEH6_9CHLO|nr:hypothetical protein CEUSTIGMA_g8906.t1 [Chlamydomonas eustigma]|eukprot:GAX81477.1 hypothetical protein CEUSTIGMA_g8906.t1 [Chlamydomonas eustigma]